MTRPHDGAVVPDVFLERFLLRELPEDEQGRIERLLALDPQLRHRLDALRASEAERLERYPAPEMAHRIRERLEPRAASERSSASRRRKWTWLVPAVAAATLALAMGLSLVPAPRPGDVVRLKGGGPGLVVFRKTASGAERLEPGAAVRPGDLVRLGYRAAGRGWGAILSTDGQGNVTLHLPRSGRRAAT